MHAAIDVSCSTAWTVDRERTPDIRPTREYGGLGSLSNLREIIGGLLELDGPVEVIDKPWRPQTLTGTNLLLLTVTGRDEDRDLAAEESEILARYLDQGGGLLLFGDGDYPPSQANGELVAGSVSFRFGDHFLSETREDAGYVLTHDVVVTAEAGHAVTRDVDTVHVHRARPILTDAMTALLGRDGDVVAAAGTRGHGRVVVVSNAEMFALPFLGLRDNLRFLLNVISWLATGEVLVPARRRAETAIASRRFATRKFDPREDLARTSGPHLIDARSHAAALEQVSGGAMPNPYDRPDAFLAEAELRFHELPRDIRQRVGQFRRCSNDYGVLMVTGLPIDPDLPPTPADTKGRPAKRGWLSELWLAAFACALGSPLAYRQEQAGALYQNVAPTAANATKISSESSAILLGFHTEMGFHPYQPDYVLLLCLRSDHDGVAKTITAGVRMFLSELTLRERAVLLEPLYRPGIDYSFGSPNGMKGNGPATSVLYGDPYDPCLNYDLDLMVGLTDQAEDALRGLRAAANRAKRWVRLRAGDLLVIDNRRAAHARSEFTARYDGGDRWLQRMCVVRDLLPSAADRRWGSRVVETLFAA